MASQLTFSVVICVLNGAQRVGKTLESLQKLDYPAAKYEVIVVNDGSTDDTVAVAEGYKGVRVVSHEQNKGHSAARNTGFMASKGKYVAYIDDDCVADSAWLTELEAALSEPHTVAAGGQIAASELKYISQRYLVRSGYGRPAPLELGETKGVWQRFKAYVGDKFKQAGTTGLKAGPVCEVYGANAAFPRTELERVKGFPTELRTSEDAAICQKLRKVSPDKKIRFNPAAKVWHAFAPTFGIYLLEVFRRQEDTIAYYRMLGKTPPVFPFPILILLVALAGAWLQWWLALVVIVAAPLVMYSWWVAAAFRNRSLEYVSYSYMQFFEEAVRGMGLAAAGLRRMNRPYPHIILAEVILALGLAGVHWLHFDWLTLPTALAAIAVPGYLLIQALGVRSMLAAPLKRLAFMAVLGVLWNMAIGLITVSVLPHLGFNRPLETQSLLAVYGIGMALLSFAALSRRQAALPVRKYPVTNLSVFLWVLTVALPFCSVVGAGLLNRGQGNIVAIISLAVAAALLAVTAWKAHRLPASLLPAVLFSVSLTALLSYTMRSAYLFGWDIQQEYEVFQQAHAIANWTIGQTHNPYDAMLSLTVFPNVLTSISHISGLAVFKVIFPILFSFVPVLLYYLYRMWAKRWISFVAAGVFVAQFYYFQEFAALARQQLAFLFFAALLYILLQKRVRGYRRVILGLLLVMGVVVSHYSTTYMAIALLAGAFILAKLFYLLRRRQWLPKPSRLVPLWVVIALLAGAVIWYGPATHSSAAFAQVGNAAGGDTGYASLPSRIKDAVEDKFKGSKDDTSGSDSGSYLQNIGDDYRQDRGYMSYYADASNKTISPVDARSLPDRLPLLRPLSVLLDTFLRYMWWIAGTVGAVWFALRAWKHFNYRNSEAVALVAMALIAFVAIHVIPSIGQYYNIPRLNQQALMFTALPAVVVLVWLAQRFVPRISRAAVLLPLIAAFLIASGLLSQAVGGRPSANLNNFGVDYQHFYIHQTEVAAAKWLDQDRGTKQEVIYADRYTNLRLVVPTTINGHVMQDITPETIAKHAYIYAGETNTLDGVSMAGYKGGVVTFQFPMDFVESHKNTLYTNGAAGVYK